MKLDREISDTETLEALQMGATPAYVETTYRLGRGIRERARRVGLEQADFIALAQRWGIKEADDARSAN